MPETTFSVTACKFRMDGGDTGRIAVALFYQSTPQGAVFVGRIDFYACSVSPLPSDYLWQGSTSASYIVISMPMNQFHDVRTLVSNELSRAAVAATAPALTLCINVVNGNTPYTNGVGSLRTGDTPTFPVFAEHESRHEHTFA